MNDQVPQLGRPITHDDGSFTVVLSLFGRVNRNNQVFHPLSDDQIAKLNERAAAGQLRGEIDQKFDMGEMSNPDAVLARVGLTDASRTALRIDEISATIEPDVAGRLGYVQRVVARVSGAGPHAEELRQRVQSESAYFGIRALTTDILEVNTRISTIRDPITWDLVAENPYPN